MCLPLWALLPALFLTPGNSEVVESFNRCIGFFLDNRLPDDALKPLNPARICQTYKNEYRFATMYDRTKRIPIYSAYVYNPGTGEGYDEWMIEPQLVNKKNNENMEDDRDNPISSAAIAASQAITSDYSTGVRIDRGHLNPAGHHLDEDSKTATYTLTNVVPQYTILNQYSWARYEWGGMRARSRGCTKVYVIAGAVPGNTFISGGRVNRPSHIWSAACCLTDRARRSWGAIASNEDLGERPQVQPVVTELSLSQLEQQLAGLYRKRRVDLFHGSCY